MFRLGFDIVRYPRIRPSLFYPRLCRINRGAGWSASVKIERVIIGFSIAFGGNA